MKKQDFQIKHSEILQQCMWMEDRLRVHYGLIKGKNDLDEFMKYTNKVDEDTLGQLISKLKSIEGEYSDTIIAKLEKAVQIRNYYAHRVFCHHNPFNYEIVKEYDWNRIVEEYEYIEGINAMLDDIYEKKLSKIENKNK